jgi:hypothetical protein
MTTRLRIACSILCSILFMGCLTLPVHAGCQDMKICHIDPATGQRVCKVFRNVCSIMPISQAVPEDRSNSIELRGLSKDELKRVIDTLGVDQSKIKLP